MVLSIERPKPHPDGWDWTCGVAIAPPAGHQRRFEAMGVDSMQALILALGMAKVSILEWATSEGFGWHGKADLGLSFELIFGADELPSSG